MAFRPHFQNASRPVQLKKAVQKSNLIKSQSLQGQPQFASSSNIKKILALNIWVFISPLKITNY
jgi:hypothetical protein